MNQAGASADDVVSKPTPAARLGAGVAVIVATALLPVTDRGLAIAAACAALVLAFARPRPRWLVATFALAMIPILAVVFPVAVADFARAARLMTRATLVALVTLGVASTLRSHELGVALAGLGLPKPLTAVIATMMRQVARLAPEGRQLLLARRLRGAHGNLLGPDVMAHLLVRAHRRAERAVLASELRGAALGVPRPVPMKPDDVWLLGTAVSGGLLVHVAARAIE